MATSKKAKKPTSTTQKEPSENVTEVKPVIDKSKPISTFSVGDEVILNGKQERILGKSATEVKLMELFTDHNGTTYGVLRHSVPGTTKVKKV